MEKVIGVAEKEFEATFKGYWFGKEHSASVNIERLTDDYKILILKRIISLNPQYLDPQNPNYYKLPNDLIVSVKRDGSYNTLYYDIKSDPKSIFCNSPGGRVIYNLPINKEIDERINKINTDLIKDIYLLLKRYNKSSVFEKKQKIESIILAGELFANVSKNNDRPRIFDFVKLSKKPESIDDIGKINYDIFDVISINDVDILDLSYEFRINIIKLLFPRLDVKLKEPKAKVIEHELGVKAEDVKKLYEKWVEQQYHEGIVIKTKYNMSYKVKPIFDIDAVIIGFAEMLEENKILGEDAVASFLVALMRDDGTYQELAHVGGGLTVEQRVDFYKLLKKEVVNSNYKATKSDGRAFHFVKPKYVIQIIYTDIISETAIGATINKMTLKYDDNQWKSILSIPFVSIISPRFEILRSQIDNKLYPSLIYANVKNATPPEINIAQISNLVPIENPKAIEEPLELPKITILLKIVFEVKWSGVLAAKKILFWATNKHNIDATYPKYIIYFADYSYSRSNPLEQSIFPFNSLEKAIQHINFIFKRPDEPTEGLLDPKTQTSLKRSLVPEPYKLEIHKDIEQELNKYLDVSIKDIIYSK